MLAVWVFVHARTMVVVMRSLERAAASLDGEGPDAIGRVPMDFMERDANKCATAAQVRPLTAIANGKILAAARIYRGP